MISTAYQGHCPWLKRMSAAIDSGRQTTASEGRKNLTMITYASTRRHRKPLAGFDAGRTEVRRAEVLSLVQLKGGRGGIRVVLDKDSDPATVGDEVAGALQGAAQFLGQTKISVEVQGDAMSPALVTAIAEAFGRFPHLSLAGISAPKPSAARQVEQEPKVLRQTIRSGQEAMHSGDLVVLGDVHVGGRVVGVEGGHRPGGVSHALVVDAVGAVTVVPAQRMDSPNDHGTGWTLADAVAAHLARGVPPLAAVEQAKAYVRSAIAGAAGWRLGAGHGPLDHFGWGAGHPGAGGC